MQLVSAQLLALSVAIDICVQSANYNTAYCLIFTFLTDCMVDAVDFVDRLHVGIDSVNTVTLLAEFMLLHES